MLTKVGFKSLQYATGMARVHSDTSKRIFTPQVVRDLMGFSPADLRLLEKIVHIGEENRHKDYSHRDLFILAICRILLDRKSHTVAKVCRYDWTNLTRICQSYSPSWFQGSGVLFCTSLEKIWLATDEVFFPNHNHGYYEGFRLEIALDVYQTCLARSEIKQADRLKNLIRDIEGQPQYETLANHPTPIERQAVTNGNLHRIPLK